MVAMLGMTEQPPGSNHNDVTVWFNDHLCHIGDGPWCQMTVMKALAEAGYDLVRKVEDTVVARWMAWTVGVADGAQKRGQWHVGTSGVRAGDVVYYNWASPYGASGSISTVDHTGMVERVVDASHRYVIEGNFGDKCQRELRDDKFIVGYWRPAYDAPPAPKPAPTPTPATTAPRFPLPAGYYFGPKSGPAQSVSGYYDHASDLIVWQKQMAKRGWHVTPSGRYDDATQKAADAFQVEKHLDHDGGKIGPQTWAAAWTARVT